MWPHRKIQLLTKESSQDWDGFKVLLAELGLCAEEKLYSENLDSLQTGVTEIIYQDLISSEDDYLTAAKAKGLEVLSVSSFLHTVFSGESVLPVRKVNLIHEGVPLFYAILNHAGFEPSLLWPEEKQWICRIGRGMHWVVPEGWFYDDKDESTLHSHYAKRGEMIDFYTGPKGCGYVGSILCREDADIEAAVCEAIQSAVQLGISWSDIRNALQKFNIETRKGNGYGIIEVA